MGTPSQNIIDAANVTAVVEDKGGRKITIKKMMPVDRMKLAEIVGAENIKNDLYFGYASLAYHVQAIDGEIQPVARSKAMLEVTVQKLGDDGLAAVGEGISKHFLDPEVSEENSKAAIKN